MAGQSQAANLGGMLSQIAGTLGTSVDAEPYVRGVQNTFRPTVTDPDSLEQQRGLMEWQNKMGRTQEAAVTMANMRDMRAQQEKAAAEQKQQRQDQMKTSMAQRTAAIQQLINNPNMSAEQRKAAIQGIENSMRLDATKAGLDPSQFNNVSGDIMKQQNAAELQQVQLEMAQGAQQQEQADQASAQALGQLSDKGVEPGSPQWDAAIANMPALANNREYVRAYENSRLQYLNNKALLNERFREDAAAVHDIQLDFPAKLLSSEHVSRDAEGNITSIPGQKLEALMKESEAYNKKPTGQRDPVYARKLQNRIDSATDAISKAVSKAEADAMSQQRTMQRQVADYDRRIAGVTPNKAEVEVVADEIKAEVGTWLTDGLTAETYLDADDATKIIERYGITIPAGTDTSRWSVDRLARLIAREQKAEPYRTARDSIMFDLGNDDDYLDSFQ